MAGLATSSTCDQLLRSDFRSISSRLTCQFRKRSTLRTRVTVQLSRGVKCLKRNRRWLAALAIALTLYCGLRVYSRRAYVTEADKLAEDLQFGSQLEDWEDRAVEAEIFVRKLTKWHRWKRGYGAFNPFETIADEDLAVSIELADLTERFWEEWSSDVLEGPFVVSRNDLNNDVEALLGAGGIVQESARMGLLLELSSRRLQERDGDADQAFRLCAAAFMMQAIFRELEMTTDSDLLDWLSTGDDYHRKAMLQLRRLLAQGPLPSAGRLKWMAELLREVRGQSVIPRCIPHHCRTVVRIAREEPYPLSVWSTAVSNDRRTLLFALLGFPFGASFTDWEGSCLTSAVADAMGVFRETGDLGRFLGELDRRASDPGITWPCHKRWLQRIAYRTRDELRQDSELAVSEIAIRVLALLMKADGKREVGDVFGKVMRNRCFASSSEQAFGCNLMTNADRLREHHISEGFVVFEQVDGNIDPWRPGDTVFVVGWPVVVQDDRVLRLKPAGSSE